MITFIIDVYFTGRDLHCQHLLLEKVGLPFLKHSVHVMEQLVSTSDHGYFMGLSFTLFSIGTDMHTPSIDNVPTRQTQVEPSDIPTSSLGSI